MFIIVGLCLCAGISPLAVVMAYSPLEMCAVGGFVRRGARSYVWRVTTVPVCHIAQINVKMFAVSTGWCPQLTNKHYALLFSTKTESSLYGPYTKYINTYVYI